MNKKLQTVQANLSITSIEKGTAIGNEWFSSANIITSWSPINGEAIANVQLTSKQQYKKVVKEAVSAQMYWQTITAPKRGDMVRQFGDALRTKKDDLAWLLSYEMGKSLQEAKGEVQEMIDICEFAVGLSRQLYGYTMHSERTEHRMYEQYHPLGVVGIISAFNFPMAVWSWNVALAWICGNTCIWKPSEKTPLCAIACQKIIGEVLEQNNLPKAISCLVIGDKQLGKRIAQDKHINLVSATGSSKMGKSVAVAVAERFGKTILELGGNNAMIVTPSANLNITIPAIVFGAIGTAGQRCTTTRRLIVHESLLDLITQKLKEVYSQLKIGSPLNQENHIGPLIDTDAVKLFINVLKEAKKQGARPVIEGSIVDRDSTSKKCYVYPAVYLAENNMEVVQKETFAPILYILPYTGEVENAIAIQNNVSQGLSSTIITQSIRESELFLSAQGSDCGIANVNIGTSGAEIGGAFGGEKETGGGRESGSDAWKAYMRRQTNTINYSTDLPLAQGIQFNL